MIHDNNNSHQPAYGVKGHVSIHCISPLSIDDEFLTTYDYGKFLIGQMGVHILDVVRPCILDRMNYF